MELSAGKLVRIIFCGFQVAYSSCSIEEKGRCQIGHFAVIEVLYITHSKCLPVKVLVAGEEVRHYIIDTEIVAV